MTEEVKEVKKEVKKEFYMIGILVIAVLILAFYMYNVKTGLDKKIEDLSKNIVVKEFSSKPLENESKTLSVPTLYINRSCDELKNEILQLFGNSNTCNNNSDCGVLSVYCGKPTNNNYISKIAAKLNDYEVYSCPIIFPDTGCKVNSAAVKCSNKKCVYA
ncbi:MAG: hypothetical protein Q8N99_01835 [Nanoarchaeota archaeon]|nr:hypothetical protein [Nanoarchaeota archaeon]